MGAGMESDSDIVMKDVCENGIEILGGKPVLILMRAGYFVGWVVVVAMGVISFSEEQRLSVTEVECLG